LILGDAQGDNDPGGEVLRNPVEVFHLRRRHDGLITIEYDAHQRGSLNTARTRERLGHELLQCGQNIKID